MASDVAIVLPPGESFSPASSGAIALLARRLARAEARFACVVVGRATARPFADVAFLPVRPRFGPGGAAWRYGTAVARELRRWPVRLVEVHNRPDLALHLARRLAPVPVSLILNNDPQGMRRAATPGERAVLLARLARVATSSEYLRRRLLEGVPAGEAVLLPNCLDPAELPPPVPKERLILFAGRVVADKGADGFVAACARALPRLPGWRAEMIGADRFGPDSPETPFLRALRPRAAAAGVAMLGYREHADVLAAMGRAAIVAVPSRWAEPFGLTALEAMASGAALLCSGRGGLAEVMGEVGVPVDPDDADGMAEAMAALAGNPARLAALGSAGRARARMFDPRHAVAALDRLREAILHSPPGRPI